MTRVAVFAAVALAVMIPAASAARSLVATPSGSRPAAALATTPTSTTDTTTTTRVVVTTTTAAMPKHVMEPKPKPIPPRPVTTTTTSIAQRAAKRAHTLGVCLTRASVNNYLAVAANRTWLRRQLRALVGRPKLAAAQSGALQIEEDQAQAEMQAQYAIDQSNCYLKHG